MRRPDDRNSSSSWGYGAAEGEVIGRVSASECRSDVKLMDLILGGETHTCLCRYFVVTGVMSLWGYITQGRYRSGKNRSEDP